MVGNKVLLLYLSYIYCKIISVVIVVIILTLASLSLSISLSSSLAASAICTCPLGPVHHNIWYRHLLRPGGSPYELDRLLVR